jgi:glutaminyl-tRNA synthetase
MYDYAHPISDAIEGITHSLCTLEFENNRELYDWVIAHTGVSERHGFSRPRQIEFARLNLDYTVLSKRQLLVLVEEGHVSGWDDPRMPTIAGMRRRGYRPEAIRAFADQIGVAKVNSTVDMAKLEFCVRDDLNWVAPRVMGVVNPLTFTVTSWPEDHVEQLRAPSFPPDVAAPGERLVPFGRRLLIERDDFSLDPPPGYQRLAPGRTVRLRHGYCVTCDEVIEEDGQVVEVRGRHLPDTVGKTPPDVKVWGVIHWVSADHAVPAQVRLYDRLFTATRPGDADGDITDNLNPDSLRVLDGARLEPSLAGAEAGSRWQLERLGYFVVDPEDSWPTDLVLNRIVTLRDSWQGRDTDVPAPSSPPRPAGDRPADVRTRPAKKSPPEYRAEARRRDPTLAERHATWPAQYGISEGDADLLTGDRATGDLFVEAVATAAPPMAVARWIINELPHELGDRDLADIPMTGRALGELVAAAESGAVSRPGAKEVLAELIHRGGDPEAIITARGLSQVSDDQAITPLVDDVLAANPDKVALYRAGKTALLGFFVGQVVRASRGAANPKVVQRLLAARLDDPRPFDAPGRGSPSDA